jgi:hypothetical protein
MAARGERTRAPTNSVGGQEHDDDVDIFDGEPYAGLMPRWLRRCVGWALLISIAFIPPARNWLFHQAQQHVIHEIQPLIDNLLELPATGGPPDTSRSSTHPATG